MKKFLAVIQSKWFIACGVVVLALLVTADWKQIQQAREVQAQINGLADQANSLEQKNRDLLSTLSALKGAGAAEAQARQQLNLKKPGEFVYSFAPQPSQGESVLGADTVGSGSATQTGGDAPGLSNPQKWYNYFFRQGS